VLRVSCSLPDLFVVVSLAPAMFLFSFDFLWCWIWCGMVVGGGVVVVLG
jgi:hypothetical protein